MKRFDHVLDILEAAVDHQTIGKHGNFWRGKTREQFIATRVFGKILLVPGNSADSNIVRAMRGLSPFGADVDPPPAGAIFDRMPAGRPPVPDVAIAFISKWIDDGCPDDEMVSPAPENLVAGAAQPLQGTGPALFIQFFREFDQFFQFDSIPETDADVGAFFNTAPIWPGFAGTPDVNAWTNAIADAGASKAIQFLSDNQLRIMSKFFGEPANQDLLNEAWWQFGKGTLPPDNLRPQDPLHRMDGAQMWLMWLAFADASMRLGMNANEWAARAKAICLGLVGDALFRNDRPPAQRLKITRYSAQDPNVRDKVIADFAQLAGNDLLAAAIGLAREARFGAPIA